MPGAYSTESAEVELCNGEVELCDGIVPSSVAISTLDPQVHYRPRSRMRSPLIGKVGLAVSARRYRNQFVCSAMGRASPSRIALKKQRRHDHPERVDHP